MGRHTSRWTNGSLRFLDRGTDESHSYLKSVKLETDFLGAAVAAPFTAFTPASLETNALVANTSGGVFAVTLNAEAAAEAAGIAAGDSLNFVANKAATIEFRARLTTATLMLGVTAHLPILVMGLASANGAVAAVPRQGLPGMSVNKPLVRVYGQFPCAGQDQ